jgi:hypothetical protein
MCQRSFFFFVNVASADETNFLSLRCKKLKTIGFQKKISWGSAVAEGFFFGGAITWTGGGLTNA